ncbi:sugar ABC transporter substrate-binding protein [Salmonella enterica subsp. enterica]|nr:sugar ABC transporter substrate-binding protein [Salmonella enterica subsp. enterica serovar Litchfield]EDV1959969.1 sugar ABC transporter substrate-binding protein [Salmonella enterica subsp. enterica serovar Litchfield]
MKLSKSFLIVPAILFTSMAFAKEYPVGGPVVHDGMEIASSYLLGIKMSPHITSMIMGDDVIHLETDVHATQDNKWGFSQDEWIPYLSINYVMTKQGDKDFLEFGQLLPMVAKDGAHYAQSVQMQGPGTYTVKLKYSAPDEKGFLHHTDEDTGTPDWFKPFVETFTFTYPQK